MTERNNSFVRWVWVIVVVFLVIGVLTGCEKPAQRDHELAATNCYREEKRAVLVRDDDGELVVLCRPYGD